MTIIIKAGDSIYHPACVDATYWVNFREPMHLSMQVQDGLLKLKTTGSVHEELGQLMDTPPAKFQIGSSYTAAMLINKNGQVYIVSAVSYLNRKGTFQKFLDITDIDFYVIGDDVDVIASINIAHSLGYTLDEIFTALETHNPWNREELTRTSIDDIKELLKDQELVEVPQLILTRGTSKWTKE